MQRRADFVVIGSGIAGLRAAAHLVGEGRVAILTKADPSESSTGYAQGGIAAALGADDAPALHAADTIAAGDGLCLDEAVRVLVEDGARYARELVEWGARFDREPDGTLALGREGAHSRRRVLHAADATGREIARTLWARVSADSRIDVYRQARASRLVVRDGACAGVRVESPDGTHEIESPAVLLATGGAGQVFRDTTNPEVATGDGVTLAWAAGARVADLEFVQFHPTVLAVPGAPRALLSEAIRGEGAHLVNADGERFMTRYAAAGELASRDVVSRAIVEESRRTRRPVYLSLRHLDPAWARARFPTAADACRAVGLDLAADRIPVGPAAHYIMGGVETDLWGRTTIPGLYAAGEVACTGVHGANRLASNSLLEGLVFGTRAAVAMTQAPIAGQLEGLREVPHDHGVPGVPGVRRVPGVPGGLPVEDAVRKLMWDHVGLERDRAGLERALRELDTWYEAVQPWVIRGGLDAARWRVATIVTVARLIARAALRREETRGGHARADFPSRDDVHWRIHVGERRAPGAERGEPRAQSL